MEEDLGIEYYAEDIKKLYKVDVKMYAEGDDGKEKIQKGDFYVAKTDDGWGILYMESWLNQYKWKSADSALFFLWTKNNDVFCWKIEKVRKFLKNF